MKSGSGTHLLRLAGSSVHLFTFSFHGISYFPKGKWCLELPRYSASLVPSISKGAGGKPRLGGVGGCWGVKAVNAFALITFVSSIAFPVIVFVGV